MAFRTVLLFVTWIAATAAVAVDLEYTNRGNYNEGIKLNPVGGSDIELISVRGGYNEPAPRMPDRLKVRFFLEDPAPVYLTVRELDYKHYYWLDKMRPATPWRRGFNNTFEWPTDVVLRQLDRLGVYDLGVIVRLDKATPSRGERVAPAILYYDRPPATVVDYLFTFKVSADARLTCTVYGAAGTEPVFSRSFRRQRGGRPFTVRWDASRAAAGAYRLVVDGYFLDTSDPVTHAVAFYHQPIVR